MFNHQHITKVKRTLRHNWLIAVCVAGFVAVLWIGAPAWAAPVAQRGGTVPRPTPTEEANQVATATPQADDSTDAPTESTPESVPVDQPNINFPQNSDGSPVSTLTAMVTVAGLNLREGPDTSFNTLGSLPANTQVTVISRNEDGTWWYICCIPNTETTGWASAQLLTPDFDVTQANTLIPVFGTTPVIAAPAATPTPQPAAQTQNLAALPLAVDFRIDPYFVWQGITVTLTITVNNPNTEDATNVLLSDELPAALTLIEATADADGAVETVTTGNGTPLLLFRWATIPADTAVTATIVALVSPTLADGDVIDNLVATRAANVSYSTSSVTIGMPPVVPPDFQ